jgi:hypothetical protein
VDIATNDTIIANLFGRKVVAGSTSKKIVAVRFDREPLQGFVSPESFTDSAGMELLSLSGGLVKLAYSDVKAVCYVRDFDGSAVWKEHRAFSNRPKTEGLWLRLHFRDGDTLEGLIANNLLLLEPLGFAVTPPDTGFQNQRVFIPRAALTRVEVLGVVGSPLRRSAKSKAERKEQLKMFE